MAKRAKPKKIRLNVGCGVDIKKGFINIDTHDKHGADLVHVLPQIKLVPKKDRYELSVVGAPLPFEDDSVDYVYCSRMLEDFLYEYIEIMKDFHRVLKPGGILHLVVPYGLDVRNPRHVRYFDETSFGEFTRRIDSQYEEGHVPTFSLVKMKVIRKNKILLWIGKHLTKTGKKMIGKPIREFKTSSSDRQGLITRLWRVLLQLSFRKKSIEVVLRK